MNDKWLKNIRDSLADYEVEEPVGLRAGLEETMKTRTPRKAAPLPQPWTRRIAPYAAAAAMLGIALGAFTYFHNSPTIPVADTPALTAHSAPTQPETAPDATALAQAAATRTDAPHTTLAYRPQRASLIPQEPAAYSGGETTPENSAAPTQPQSDAAPDTAVCAYSTRLPAITGNTAAATRTRRTPHAGGRRTDGRLAFALSTASGTGSATNRRAVPMMLHNSVGTDGASWDDKPMLGILAFNQGKAIKTEINHRLPVKTAATFTYRLTDRLGIESGLSYTYLASDIHEGSNSHYIDGHQALHYIGVPLNLKYRLLSWKRLELYASAGALAEKCVSARRTDSYIIDQANTRRESYSLGSKPMQWSVNAAAGAQLNIAGPLGIYVEPGVSYYFDDRSPLRTIYKDKPVNLNLNFGIRYTIE